MISPIALGQSVSSRISDLEILTYQNAGEAYNELVMLSDDVIASNRQTKIRWLLTTLTAAYDHSNFQAVQSTADFAPQLLASGSISDTYWLELFAAHKLFIQGKYADALPLLQSYEDKIISLNEPLLTAFFHNMLFFTYSVNGMADFALDLAIVNRKEWIQQEQYYYALEVLFRIANIRLNLGDFEGASNAIDLAKEEAEQLKADNMSVGIIELKSNILLAQEQPEAAYDILNALLESRVITQQHDKYQSVVNNLAFAAFLTGKFQQSIDLARESLNLPAQVAPALKAQLTVLMAKAHNELGNHELAEALISQSRESFVEQNNQFSGVCYVQIHH